MSKVLFLILALPFLASAQSKSVFLCKSSTRTFEIEVSYRTKAFTGTLKSYRDKPMTMSCEEKKNGYLCKQGEYIARVFQGSNGRMTVHMELTGDFGPFDSGYLYTIPCQ